MCHGVSIAFQAHKCCRGGLRHASGVDTRGSEADRVGSIELLRYQVSLRTPCSLMLTLLRLVAHQTARQRVQSASLPKFVKATLARCVRSNPCSQCRGKSFHAPDMAVSPLCLSPPDSGTCRLDLYSKEYRAAGPHNPGKRLAISWHHPGIFCQPLPSRAILAACLHGGASGGETRGGHACGHGQSPLLSSSSPSGLPQGVCPWAHGGVAFHVVRLWRVDPRHAAR
jgi:hypothetical protein